MNGKFKAKVCFKEISYGFCRLMNLATERLKIIFSQSAYYFESLTDSRGVSFPTILIVRVHEYR